MGYHTVDFRSKRLNGDWEGQYKPSTMERARTYMTATSAPSGDWHLRQSLPRFDSNSDRT